MDPKENQNLQHERSRQRQEEREAAAERVAEGEAPAAKEQPGVISVVDAVRDIEFPATKRELEKRAGDREVWTSRDRSFALKDVLPKLKSADEFASVRDFQSAVQRHWAGIEFMETAPENRPERGGPQPGQRD